MHLPGFSAEASLYKTTGVYRTVIRDSSAAFEHRNSGTAHPSSGDIGDITECVRKLDGCFQGCYGDSICRDVAFGRSVLCIIKATFEALEHCGAAEVVPFEYFNCFKDILEGLHCLQEYDEALKDCNPQFLKCLDDCIEKYHECIPCPSGQTNCSGICVDTSTNSNNCGGCNTLCLPGQDCCGGFCCDPTTSTCCPDGCHDGANDVCCPGGGSCSEGQTCCPDGCYDVGPNGNCCGDGNACPFGQNCCPNAYGSSDCCDPTTDTCCPGDGCYQGISNGKCCSAVGVCQEGETCCPSDGCYDIGQNGTCCEDGNACPFGQNCCPNAYGSSDCCDPTTDTCCPCDGCYQGISNGRCCSGVGVCQEGETCCPTDGCYPANHTCSSN